MFITMSHYTINELKQLGIKNTLQKWEVMTFKKKLILKTVLVIILMT